jgi:hypothetical protein
MVKNIFSIELLADCVIIYDKNRGKGNKIYCMFDLLRTALTKS